MVYLTIRYGLRPKPVPIMNPSEFERADQIGAVIYRRLKQNIRPERLIVLGSSPELSRAEEVWDGFLKTALADGLSIDAFYQFESLSAPEVFAATAIPYTEAQIESGEFAKTIKSRLQAGHLVVVHGSTRRVSHLVTNSLSRQLDDVVHHPVLAVSTLPISIKAEELQSLQEACQSTPETRLNCAVARVSRTLSKKRDTPGKLWSVMERHGLQEYLVFIQRE
jgi:hypothetical protein